ncbi:hypothetical protein TPHA_0G01730 [Tetrapisispora phaffii CBS 4417]|uniref:mitogen-activated protein kinase kinase n=1 Tax=Tetrapisispora phaffii (strain ATCC 24235 / CBS 4417 / NBRC 1672 / NRRL Y-8282 / UCD 70-5) TaxID=1071381 RepID=G8BVT1_TETPH|nr:hypothetical protein TPHA_0G01730 [Tetrapisispora phaffii CBS 4417]CCE64009.1 hypothetical protein TPHA_0G01730 [Tetrapisispora phaffii CBS 4417]
MASLFRPPESARLNSRAPELKLPPINKIRNPSNLILDDEDDVEDFQIPIKKPSQNTSQNIYSSTAINGYKKGNKSVNASGKRNITPSTNLNSLAIPSISSSSSSLHAKTVSPNSSSSLASSHSDSTLVPNSGCNNIRQQPYSAISSQSSPSSSTRKNRPLPPPLPASVIGQSVKNSPTVSIKSNVDSDKHNIYSPSEFQSSLRKLNINATDKSNNIYSRAENNLSIDSYSSNIISTYADDSDSPVKTGDSTQPASQIPKTNDYNSYNNSVNSPEITQDIDKLDATLSKNLNIKDKIVTLGLLGEGAGGSVVKCKLKNGSKIFALKTINTLNSDPEFQKQIFRELQFNKSFKCNYIVQYYGMFEDLENSTILIAMEYMGGKSLDSIYKHLLKLGGRISEKVLGKIAESVLKGLSYLHEKKVIHRDIKPQNILLNDKGEIKLCDFGVSGEAVNSLATTFTGTSYYMAPERIKGQPYSVTCDVWSLGLTLLEVAQAKFPFGSNNDEKKTLSNNANIAPIELLMLIVTFTPVLNDEPELNIIWSKSFKSFIEYCLKKEPRERPSPRQMINHPWVQGQMKKKVNMEKFIKKCWKDEA